MEDNKKEEILEEPKTKSKHTKTIKGKGLTVYIIIIVVIAVALCYGCGFLLGKQMYENKEDNQEETKEQDTPSGNVPIDGDEITDSSIINKLDTFINTATAVDSTDDELSLLLYKGASELSATNKAAIVYKSVVFYDKKVETIARPAKYDTDDTLKYFDEFEVVKFDYVNDAYRTLFDEEPTSDLYNNIQEATTGSCPFTKVDEELGIVILLKECGGTRDVENLSKIYKHTSDDSYYYVYQYVGKHRRADTSEGGQPEAFFKISTEEEVNVTSFDGNESSFETVVWKFDKNYNFVSTEIKE